MGLSGRLSGVPGRLSHTRIPTDFLPRSSGTGLDYPRTGLPFTLVQQNGGRNEIHPCIGHAQYWRWHLPWNG
eukprot:scaffold986_cov252-Alexandrium_tamarense.AAC.1